MMRTNYSGYQNPEYISGYVSPNFDVIQRNLQDKQRRFDAVQELYGQQLAKLNEAPISDPIARQAMIDNFSKGFTDLYTRYSGDISGNLGEFTQYLHNYRADKGWKLLEEHAKAVEDQQKMLQQFGKDALVFKSVPSSIVDANGKYLDSKAFAPEIERMADYPAQMEQVWNNALFEDPTISGEWYDEQGNLFKTSQTSGGIKIDQVKGKYDLVKKEYKNTSEYKQQKRYYQDILGMSEEEATKTIDDQLFDVGAKRTHKGSSKFTMHAGPKQSGSGSGSGLNFQKNGLTLGPASPYLNPTEYTDYDWSKVSKARPGDPDYAKAQNIINAVNLDKDMGVYNAFIVKRAKALMPVVSPGDAKLFPNLAAAVNGGKFDVEKMYEELRRASNRFNPTQQKKGTGDLGNDNFVPQDAKDRYNELLTTLDVAKVHRQKVADKIIADNKSFGGTFWNFNVSDVNVPETVRTNNEQMVKSISTTLSGIPNDNFTDVMTGNVLPPTVQKTRFLGILPRDGDQPLVRVEISRPADDGKGVVTETRVLKVNNAQDPAMMEFLKPLDLYSNRAVTKSVNTRFKGIMKPGTSTLIDKNGQPHEIQDGYKVGVTKNSAGTGDLYYLYKNTNGKEVPATFMDIYRTQTPEKRVGQIKAFYNIPSWDALDQKQKERYITDYEKIVSDLNAEDNNRFIASSTYDLENLVVD